MKKCIAAVLAAALGIGAGLALSVMFQVTDITDNTMLPAFSEGDKALVSRWAFSGGRTPSSGDVVLFPNESYSPTGEGRIMVKRVIAGPGDQVLITGGAVYVNNKAIEESYIFTPGVSGELEPVDVPAGSVFVLGDNRAQSTDSRSETVGLVNIEDILGKVIFQW